jgi:hypothetical protein
VLLHSHHWTPPLRASILRSSVPATSLLMVAPGRSVDIQCPTHASVCHAPPAVPLSSCPLPALLTTADACRSLAASSAGGSASSQSRMWSARGHPHPRRLQRRPVGLKPTWEAGSKHCKTCWVGRRGRAGGQEGSASAVLVQGIDNRLWVPTGSCHPSSVSCVSLKPFKA